MINEKVMLQIRNEIGKEMCNYDVLSLLRLLNDILQADCPIEELKGIKERYPKAINVIFDSNATMGAIISSLSDYFKLEALFKVILYFVEPDMYEEKIQSVAGFSGILKLLKLNPSNENLNKERNRLPEERFLRQIANVYKLRNVEAHACRDWGRNALFENVNDVMIAVLYCLSLHKKLLEKNVAILDVQPLLFSGIDAYMNELISFFKKKMKKYIDLNGEENLNIINRYIIEADSEEVDEEELEEDATTKRYGTIDEIRKNKLPEHKMMIWGEAGTGKSTTLEYLAYTDALAWQQNNRNFIPVFVPLGILTSMNESILTYIANKLNTSEDSVQNLLKKGRFNFFIDGINEISKDAGLNLKAYRLKEIKNLLDNFSQNRYIISNRPNDIVEFGGVPVFSLVKMSDEQLSVFLQRNTTSKETIKIILDAINSKPRLKSIIRTPLMFSRLIDIVEITEKVPTSEGQIIGAFLDTLFIREKNEKMDALFDVRKANYLLRSIAYNGLEESSTNAGMTEETVLSYMRKCMTTYSFQADTFYMLEIFEQLGILVKRESLYVFAHQAYQDYYHAAEEMAILGI